VVNKNFIYGNYGNEIKGKLVLTEIERMSIILCKLIDEFSKFNTLLIYLHKNFYTLEIDGKLRPFIVREDVNAITVSFGVFADEKRKSPFDYIIENKSFKNGDKNIVFSHYHMRSPSKASTYMDEKELKETAKSYYDGLGIADLAKGDSGSDKKKMDLIWGSKSLHTKILDEYYKNGERD